LKAFAISKVRIILHRMSRICSAIHQGDAYHHFNAHRLSQAWAMHRDGAMRRLNMARTAVVAMGLYGAAALAADSGINLNTKVLTEKVAVRVATGNPTVVAVKAQGPINANLRLQGRSNSCVALLLQIAAGVCVPSGPGGPVSPN
jgi:hypothetical protein